MSSSNPFLEFPQMKPPLFMMGSKAVKWKANTRVEVAPNCPRCFSSNTKFCYYNNYSVSQPRFFCKSCRRYWTKGGSLRNVPIGGKTRRARSRSSPRPTESVVHAAAAPPNQTLLKEDYDHHHDCSSNSVSHVINGGDQLHGCLAGQDHFVYQNFDVFEVEGVNNLGSEMLWSNLESFGYQQPPLMEMQEFEVFSTDDRHLRMSDDNFMATDNWGSFDLSTYENF